MTRDRLSPPSPPAPPNHSCVNMSSSRLSLRSRLRFMALAGLMVGLATTGCRPPAAAGPDTSPAPSPPAVEVPAGPPLFEDVTAGSGIEFTYRNGEDTANHLSILESLGGGVGLIDYRRRRPARRLPAGGGGFAGADKKNIVGSPVQALPQPRRREVPGRDRRRRPGQARRRPAVVLHPRRRRRRLRPRRLARPARHRLGRRRPVPQRSSGRGETRRKGRRFEDVTATAGLDKGITWATSAAFADLDGDGYPDLYVCQYVDWSWENHPLCNYDGKTPDVCPPKSSDGLPHKVYRNTGKGAFVDVEQRGRPPTRRAHARQGAGRAHRRRQRRRQAGRLRRQRHRRQLPVPQQVANAGTIRLEERGLASGVGPRRPRQRQRQHGRGRRRPASGPASRRCG